MPIVPKKRESLPKISTVLRKPEIMEKLTNISEWQRLYRIKEARVLGFEKILEDVLHCDKIKETEKIEVYKCTFEITPKDVPQLHKPKVHSFEAVISKVAGDVIIRKGNLPEPLPVTMPLDLLNAYYIVVEWNKIRDFLIWYNPREFENNIKEIWENFKKEMKEEGIPVGVLERRKLGASVYLSEKVLKTIAEKTNQSEREILAKLREIPHEIEAELSTLAVKFESEFKKLLEKMKK